MIRQTEHTIVALSGEQTALALGVLKAFYAAWKAVAVYEESNSVYVARRRELLDALKAVFEDRETCEIVYQSDYFFFNGHRLSYDREFSFGRTLASRFNDLKLGSITISATAPATAIDQVLVVLAHTDTRVADPYLALQETLSNLNVEGISVGPLAPQSSDRLIGQEPSEADQRVVRRRHAHALFQRSESVVQEFWERARDRSSFDASATRRVVHQLIDQIANDEETLLEFTTLKEFDEYTYYHCVNVAIYSIAVGIRLGLDRTRLTQLGLTALFHDIGKVKLSQDLINKPQEFDENDWSQIRQHPILGALTLARMRQIDEQIGLAMAGAFEHHLRMDGTGYPALTRPRALHLFSRIIMLCDVFDAMTSGRVYHKTKTSPDEVMRRLIYKAKEWYDPLVLKAFIHVLGIFPVGTLARLSDKSVAVITRNMPDDPYTPEVLVIRDSSGTPARREVRLARRERTSGEEGLYIAEILDPKTENINIHEYIAIAYQAEETPEAVAIS
jgi:HD-GYP domain-containing protein (c-di-GMP phosphodiesterase class II)